ncbi:hypothetical protein TNCV_3689291 [Trichonephila clavipes]|uniref:Uncharacterized protein n=1 Tax=Trichonephila clavipes TaxID=2585209 RepID=A0A8X6SNT3_TRICX|nr:hypothetical protein TNCV_3689291 [Trichonephila clavipes]
MTSNAVELWELVNLGSHNEEKVFTCNVQTQLFIGAGSNGCCEDLIDEMAKMIKYEARLNNYSIGPNCSNGIIVDNSMYKQPLPYPSLYTPPFHGTCLMPHSGF